MQHAGGIWAWEAVPTKRASEWHAAALDLLPNLNSRLRAAQFVPFIQGPRNCLGQFFALLEARVVLALLVKVPAIRLSASLRCTLRVPEADSRCMHAATSSVGFGSAGLHRLLPCNRWCMLAHDRAGWRAHVFSCTGAALQVPQRPERRRPHASIRHPSGPEARHAASGGLKQRRRDDGLARQRRLQPDILNRARLRPGFRTAWRSCGIDHRFGLTCWQWRMLLGDHIGTLEQSIYQVGRA